MVATRVVVVSDTHLSHRTPEALANWDNVVDFVTAARPDLVVHTGDITADGPAHPGDLPLARGRLARMRVRHLVVPGNHDVGDRATAQSMTRYRATFGQDQWTVDVRGWRLVGINCLLFGSGLEDEADQWRWLASVLRPGRRHIGVVLFVHKPLLPTPSHPDDADPNRYVLPAARDRLLELLAPWPSPTVASGHTHQFCHHRSLGVKHIWAPTTWAVIPDHSQPRHGDKVCGVLALTLGDDGTATAALVQPPGITQHELVGLGSPEIHASYREESFA